MILVNTTSMTDQESIDQIVHFFNDVDLPGVSIFSLYTGHMLTIYQDDNLSMCVSESDSDVPRSDSDYNLRQYYIRTRVHYS